MAGVRVAGLLHPLLTQHRRTLAPAFAGCVGATLDVGVCRYCVIVLAFSCFIRLLFVDLLLGAGHSLCRVIATFTETPPGSFHFPCSHSPA